MYDKENCPCKRVNCVRYGDCEACRKHHSSMDKKELTSCERLEKKLQKKKEKED